MKDLKSYIDAGNKSVCGWLDPEILNVTGMLKEKQLQFGLKGPVAEIGVHHGRFLIGLHLLHPDQMALGIDLFNAQDLNIDRSGKGNLQQFTENVQTHVPDPSKVKVYQADSMNLKTGDIEALGKGLDFFVNFSIDGGHTSEHTYSDLKIAEEMTHQGGLIFIDDYYNDFWPGVHEGVAKYYFFSNFKFAPLFYGFKKLILTGISYHEHYLKYLEGILPKKYPDCRIKKVKRYGWDSIGVRQPEAATKTLDVKLKNQT